MPKARALCARLPSRAGRRYAFAGLRLALLLSMQETRCCRAGPVRRVGASTSSAGSLCLPNLSAVSVWREVAKAPARGGGPCQRHAFGMTAARRCLRHLDPAHWDLGRVAAIVTAVLGLRLRGSPSRPRSPLGAFSCHLAQGADAVGGVGVGGEEFVMGMGVQRVDDEHMRCGRVALGGVIVDAGGEA